MLDERSKQNRDAGVDFGPDYTPGNRSRVKRYHQRGAYDRASVYAVFDACPMAHIGYTFDGQPYVTPTLLWREDDRLYWHGSSASRMLRQVKTGIPVCVTAALFDGWVLARSAMHHSANFRSAMAFGTAAPVEDPTHKEHALKVMMDQIFPGRWETLRPVNAQELKATSVVSMEIEEASAKTRSGPPVDDDEDYALDIWAGILPLTTQTGALEPDPKLKAGVVAPASLARPLR